MGSVGKNSRSDMPEIGEDVIVHGANYRCLGYYGEDRRWHSSFSGQLLQEVKGWSRLSDNKVTQWQRT